MREQPLEPHHWLVVVHKQKRKQNSKRREGEGRGEREKYTCE